MFGNGSYIFCTTDSESLEFLGYCLPLRHPGTSALSVLSALSIQGLCRGPEVKIMIPTHASAASAAARMVAMVMPLTKISVMVMLLQTLVMVTWLAKRVIGEADDVDAAADDDDDVADDDADEDEREDESDDRDAYYDGCSNCCCDDFTVKRYCHDSVLLYMPSQTPLNTT